MIYSKYSRLLKICLTSVLAISLIGVSSGCDRRPDNSNMVVTKISPSYQEEVKKPEWLTKKSELIVIGKIIDKGKVGKGPTSASDGDEVVYTDTNVQVIEIIKNKLKNDVSVGDKISVRTLGGALDNLVTKADSMDLFTNSEDVLLFLADGTNDPTLPNTPDKQYYCVVGRIHGAFNLTSDGKAKRSIVKDEFKLSDLKELIKSQEK